MKKQSRFFYSTGQALKIFCFASLLVTMLAGCSRHRKEYIVRPEFSVNVGEVDPGWPKDVNKIGLAQQEVMRMRGRPERIHVLWSVDGQVMDKINVTRMKRENEKLSPKLSWIYLSQNVEVVFLDSFNFRAIPLSDQLKTLCALGDPQEIKRLAQPNGKIGEKWCYWNQGRLITFIDGTRVSEENVQPMPHLLTK